MADVPAAVTAEISALRTAVRAVVPKKKPKNLLIGSWNLRAFGDVTPKWNAAAGDSPKRDWRAVALIAALMSYFDVISVQEVRRETEALRFLLTRLGPDWKVITSDVTEGDEGNGERLSFVYDSTRVQPSGLVGEIVLPSTVTHPAQQFARTPYAASFRREDIEFILTSVHIIWGKNVTERIPELTKFANWMRAWADRPTDWNRNLLLPVKEIRELEQGMPDKGRGCNMSRCRNCGEARCSSPLPHCCRGCCASARCRPSSVTR